jgi:hypothetical protein
MQAIFQVAPGLRWASSCSKSLRVWVLVMAVPEILIETFLLNLQKIIQRVILGGAEKRDTGSGCTGIQDEQDLAGML